MTELINREFIGTVLADKDLDNQGKYKVNISELQLHTKDRDGIWVKNHVCRNRVSPSEDGISGSYYPLHAGMAVVVKFFANHIESGYIDRVISDSYIESLPFKSIDRDNIYQIIRTPVNNNLIVIYEGTEDEVDQNGTVLIPKNSIHIYYNNTRTTVVIDENGINVKSEDNVNLKVAKNVAITVTGTADIKTTGNTNIQSAANVSVKAAKVFVEGGDTDIKGSTVKIGDGTVHIKGAAVNIDGAVNINGGAAQAPSSASDAADAADPVLIAVDQDYEYFKKDSGR